MNGKLYLLIAMVFGFFLIFVGGVLGENWNEGFGTETTMSWEGAPKQFTSNTQTSMSWNGSPSQYYFVQRQLCPEPSEVRYCNG